MYRRRAPIGVSESTISDFSLGLSAVFDDDERNVDVARRAGFAGATLVDRDVGFTRESWEGRLGEAVGMRGLDVPGFRSGSLTGS